jgi:hypothetical protein
MQTIQNTILNTDPLGLIAPPYGIQVTALNGPWRNVSNFLSSSIQIVARAAATGLPIALDGTVWIEVSNDPNINIDNLATQISAPVAPTLSQFTPSSQGNQAAYAFPAVTYGVILTYVNLAGETVGSAATTITTLAGNTIGIAPPGPDAGGCATGYNVYMNVGGGAYSLQNPLYNSGQTFGNLAVANGPINVNQGFILYAFMDSGIVVPTANTTATPNKGANITGNLVAAAVAGTNNEAAVIYDTANSQYASTATTVMWLPAHIYFNWVRVCATSNSTSTNLQAYLFGTNG